MLVPSFLVMLCANVSWAAETRADADQPTSMVEQVQSNANQPEPAPDNFREGTLWRVTSSAGVVGHILGTLHIGTTDDLKVPAYAWALLGAARRLVVEVATDTIDPVQLEELHRLSPGQDWSANFKRRDFAQLQNRLERAGFELTGLGRLQPWLITNLLATASYQQARSLDSVVIAKARAAGIEVMALESLAQQLAIFDCVNTKEHLLVLREALSTGDDYFLELNREAIRLYASQRTGDMMDALIRGFPHGHDARVIDARLTQCAIIDRNVRFVAGLAEVLTKHDTFVAIGAAHFPGSNGILALLELRGFKVERVLQSLAAQSTPSAIRSNAPPAKPLDAPAMWEPYPSMDENPANSAPQTAVKDPV